MCGQSIPFLSVICLSMEPKEGPEFRFLEPSGIAYNIPSEDFLKCRYGLHCLGSALGVIDLSE
jgi:hypothetical protein